jgi:hypothetical protein
MEQLETRHEPTVVRQVQSCTGTEHAMHRELTGLVLYYCNCGYSTGWVSVDTVVSPDAFIADHPPYFRVQGSR